MGGGAWFWFEVQTLLRQSGFNTTAVDLTSHGINKAVADNVTTVAEYTNPLIDAIAAIPGQVRGNIRMLTTASMPMIRCSCSSSSSSIEDFIDYLCGNGFG